MFRSSRASGWVIGLAVTVQVCWPASGDESPPVVGDPSLLIMMRDAQHANEGRYAWGEADVIAEIGRRGEPPLRRVVANVRWDGDQQRIIGTSIDRGTPPGESAPRIFKGSFDLIYRDGRSVVYDPDSRVMTISAISQGGQFLLTQLRPQDWWHGKINGEGRLWSEQFDTILRRPPEFLRHVRVRRLGDDQIEMIRDSGAAGWYRLVSSLRDDGNLVLVEMVIPESDFEEKQSYRWTRDERGRCYLKSCRVERHAPKRDGRSTGGLYLNYDVTRFDPDQHPAQSTFEDRSIRVAPGTVVDDRITGKRRRIGDRPVEGMNAALDRLVPELKSRGFAAPLRDR